MTGRPFTCNPLIVGDLMGGGYKIFGWKYKYNILFVFGMGLFIIINWDSLCDCHIQSLAFSLSPFYPISYVFLTNCNSGSYQFGKSG